MRHFIIPKHRGYVKDESEFLDRIFTPEERQAYAEKQVQASEQQAAQRIAEAKRACEERRKRREAQLNQQTT